MVFQSLARLSLFAQDTAAAARPQPSMSETILSMTFMVFLLLVAFWLLFILPKRKQEKQMKRLYDSLKKNDKVMTSSGIIAMVHSVDRERGEVVLKVDESNNTKIRFSIQSIYYIFPEKSEEGQAATEKK
ncbi:MAG: preprotein translocase subunit YajC [Thermoguttaceae bacterium]|jgi:preprotein translocase subunit YajC